MNAVEIRVTNRVVGIARTWAYPDGDSDDHFLIPTYAVMVSGSLHGSAVSKGFEALRFGVLQHGSQAPRVVGLVSKHRSAIRAWLPKYEVHSYRTKESGAWLVFGNFLVHDGPDDPLTQAYASIGCVEICDGPQGFNRFNDYLISLAGPKATDRANQLIEMGRSEKLMITYDHAPKPPLAKWGS